MHLLICDAKNDIVCVCLWVCSYIKNKPEANEIGSLQGMDVNGVERREEWE